MGKIIRDNITYAGSASHALEIRYAEAEDPSAWGVENVQEALDHIKYNMLGKKDGIATLDGEGHIPATQLPSFVDDILEFDNKQAFPTTGEKGKIYVALDTDLTYRWGETEYIEISKSLALGEGELTAYRGDRGKVAYDHASETKNNQAISAGLYKVGSTANGHISELTAITKADITNLGIPEADTHVELVDNLTSDDASKALTAKQGKALATGSAQDGATITGFTRSGTTITYTKRNGGTGTFTTQDTTYGGESPIYLDGGKFKVYNTGILNGATHSDYNNNQSYLVTKSFMSYWNGAYNANHNSNLTYCAQGSIIGSNNIGSQRVNYANSAGSASSAGSCTGNSATASKVIDYGNTANSISIGYTGTGLNKDNLSHLAGYTDNGTKIKDVSKDTLKAWLGTGSGTNTGVTNVYGAADCTTYQSDSGACTPAAVKKAFNTFSSLNSVIPIVFESDPFFIDANSDISTQILAGANIIPSGYSIVNMPVSVNVYNGSDGSLCSYINVYGVYPLTTNNGIQFRARNLNTTSVARIRVTVYALGRRVS